MSRNANVSKPDNNPLHDSLHELSRDVSQLVIREQQLLNEELLRMSSLLREAATDLRYCFTIMGQHLDHQALLLRAKDPAAPEERRRDDSREKLLLATSEMGSYISKVVRALQFEDIMQQLIGHSRRRAEEIEKMFSSLQERIDDMQEYDVQKLEKVLAVLESCHKEIATVKEALTLANPVKQQTMKKGDVTIF
ncbi:MAG: hypothetical protein ACRESK_04195 [Gammaproteobacteria bacterium]